MVGWFRRVRLPPPALVLIRFRPPALFSSLTLSGFARCGLGVFMFVLSLSFFLLRSPSRVPVKQFFISSSIPSNLLFSSSFSSHRRGLIFPPSCVCVCVCVASE